MSWLAARPDLAVDDPHRRRRRVELATNAMWHPEQRHDSTFDEWHRLRQRLEPRGNPCPLCCQKSQARALRHPARQNELDLALDRVDPQSYPPRPLADPD